MKKNQIFRKFKQEIISGVRKDGDKLPTEFECMTIFGVSRDTVRSAYKMLEEEGFLKRVRSKGSFIQLPDTSPEKRNISLLVPCEEYLRYSGLHFQTILFDLIAETALAGWSLTPVIFSRTNSNTDIWWKNLEKFNSSSRIVVNRTWFAPYFETLSAMNAKVAFINNDTNDQSYSKYTSKWIRFTEGDSVIAKKAVHELYKRGYRKIALVMPDIMEPFNSMTQGYLQQVAESGLKPILVEEQRESARALNLKQAWKENKFDALIIHINEFNLPRKNTLHESLAIPEEIPIIAIPCKSASVYQEGNENLMIVKYPIRQMASDIVHCLIDPQYIPKEFFYTPSIESL